MAGIRTGNNSGNHPNSPEPQVAPGMGDSKLYIKTLQTDDGTKPTNAGYNALYQSWDVVVRRDNEFSPGVVWPGDDTLMEQQTPEFDALNYVYVRSRKKDKSADLASGTEKIYVYWACACTGLQWPKSFDNTKNSGLGGLVRTLSLVNDDFSPNGICKQRLPWNLTTIPKILQPTPKPGELVHTCLLVRIVPTTNGSVQMGPFESMPGETNNLADNVKKFANIAWLNTNVLNQDPKTPVASSWVLIAPSERPRLFRLTLAESRSALIQRRKMRMSIWGNHIGRLVNRIYPTVAAVGPVAGDVDRGEGDEYITVDSSMDFILKPTAEYIKLEFNIDSQDGWPAGERQEFDVVEYAGDDDQLFVGGQHFVLDTDYLRKPQEPRRRSIDCPDDRPAQRRGLLQRLLSPRGRGR